MYNVSVPMALMDFVPVVFFGISAAILRRDLFGKMSRQSFSMFSAGTMFIFVAGLLKATWKLLYGAGICDFQVLNTMFLPVQSIGFLLAGAGIIVMFLKRKAVMLSVAPPVFSAMKIFRTKFSFHHI